jgi:hypothetical protein
MDTLQFNAWKGTIREIAVDDTLDLSDWQAVVTTAASVWLPDLASAYDSTGVASGYGFQFDVFCAAAPCTVYALGTDSIYVNAQVVLTEGDNASFRAFKEWWMLR